ncbi:hypothetical protein FO519_007860 [Halicephalobus sp. NKZ332]|nr:hypothetical protein FO519_007860 [Halicephalobus sp. NKZ332]
MDFFYIPWISSLKAEDDSLEGTEITVYSIPEPLDINPRYKLTFFSAKGMAEMSRLILAYVGEPFIDNRISFEQWKENKDGLLFRQLPILEFDGQSLCHSVAIARYLAKQYGLAGKTLFEQAEVDGIMEVVMNLITSLKPCIFSLIKKRHPEINTSTFCEEPISESATLVINKYLPILEHYASKKTLHGFLSPGGLTFADFGVAVCFEILENLHPDGLEPYSSLRTLKNKVHGLPQLQQYLKTRPKTVF